MNIDKVTVSPLVLLSVLDHHQRTNTPEDGRSVGVILGEYTKSNTTSANDNSRIGNNYTINVTNSFALPFEEDRENDNVWFLDHNYINNMYDMFKKINAKEKIVGWYHTGAKLNSSDLKIHQIFNQFVNPNYSNLNFDIDTKSDNIENENSAENTTDYHHLISKNSFISPLLLIVDTKQEDIGLPITSYLSQEQIMDDGTTSKLTFIHLPCDIEAEEAEEIGVEHLLRDVRDQAAPPLSIKLTNQLNSLKGLQKKLGNIINYLNNVIEKKLPLNHLILGKLQDVFNLLPNLGHFDVEEIMNSSNDVNSNNTNNNNKWNVDLQRALTVKTNDELMMIYITNLVRSIIAFDNLIENKIQNAKI